MTEQWFLKIDGVEGESKVKGHEKAIDVLAWTWGVTHEGGTASGAGGGGSAGKPTFQDLTVVTVVSKASPQLVLACASGKHFPTAVLTGVRGSGKSVLFLQYELGDVNVSSIDHGDDDDGSPVEEFSLHYRKFEITYTPQGAGGAAGTPVHAGWDTVAGTEI